ncbi:MAG TPA: alanine racemase [Gammaproteobacteria bacterium]|nr:alanine racemase [Gammaproteobacteria bacterium]
MSGWGWAEISSEALLHNLRHVRRLVGSANVSAVVKSDAYGHGLENVAGILSGHVDAFAVATCEEGTQVRRIDAATPIWVFLGFADATELEACSSHRLIPVVSNYHQIELLYETHLPLTSVILELDIGMGRLGFDFSNTHQMLREFQSRTGIRADLILGHLPSAEGGNDSEVRGQFNRFLEEANVLGGELTLANSAALMAYPYSHLDWVRPGLMLYGVSPFSDCRGDDSGLRPAMRVFSRIRGTRMMRSGQAIGYGSRFRCKEDTRVGLLGFGYADGFPRQEISSGSVTVGGHRCPILGRISMDSMIVDLSKVPSAQAGDVVELWGQGVSAEEVASHAGLIPHQLLTHLGPRVDRVLS